MDVHLRLEDLVRSLPNPILVCAHRPLKADPQTLQYGGAVNAPSGGFQEVDSNQARTAAARGTPYRAVGWVFAPFCGISAFTCTIGEIAEANAHSVEVPSEKNSPEQLEEFTNGLQRILESIPNRSIHGVDKATEHWVGPTHLIRPHSRSLSGFTPGRGPQVAQ